MNVNSSQIYGILRIAIPSVIAILAYLHVISDSMATNLTAMVLSLLGSVAVSAYANTTLNLSKTVAATPGLQVHVDTNAPAELQEAAADRTVKDIVPATGAPTPTSPYEAQRKYES